MSEKSYSGGEPSCSYSVNDCCTGEVVTPYDKKEKWLIGQLTTASGNVPVVSTQLNFQDTLGTWKVRWGIGRMSYMIAPGLYAVGNPDKTSPVLVSGNYKLTFDTLRQELSGLACWLLVLDTKGVNVWCAAGKGTFGTGEVVNRIKKSGLNDIVAHRTLILPQLGAPGVSAHEVTKQTGFSVVYGPVRACDVKAFIDSGFQATEEMRTVKFTIWDRVVLTPIELAMAAKKSLMLFGVLFLVNFIAVRPFGLADLVIYSGAVLIGTVVTPVLLPLIPGKAFSWKGWLLGLCWVVWFSWLNNWYNSESLLLASGYILLLPALSAFLAMNFTGSSTYTSFSGVIKEMKVAMPLIALTSTAGIVLLLINTLSGH